MKYNLIRSSITETNLTEGNTDLTTNEILALADNEGTPVTTLSGGSVLCLDTDLGSRISLHELQYYFDSSADKATTAGEIEFFYKNESFEVYTSLATTYTGSGNLYNATTSSGIFAPRYVRTKHTVTNSGTLYGYEVLSNDDVVDFGTDGTLTSETISVSRNYGVDIKEVPIYNNGPGVVDAIVLVEPQNTDIDYLLSVSNSDSGPWYGPHTDELLLAAEGSWDLGNYDGTTKFYNGEYLSIAGEVDTGAEAYPLSIQEGKYETNLFQSDSSRLNHIHVFVDNADEGLRVTNNLTDTADTIDVKTSSSLPTPYSVYIKLVESSNDIYADTYWQKTETLKERSGVKASLGYSSDVLGKYKVYVDPNTGDYGGFYYADSSATAYTYSSYVYLFNCKNDTSFVKTAVAAYVTHISHTQYKSRMNTHQDQWFYFFSGVYDSGYEVDETGYYLMCYDKNMDKLFKYFRTDNFLIDFDIVYNTHSVWIADTDGGQMKQFDSDGTVLTLYNAVGITDDLRSVSVDNRDDSVWFANGVDLHRISKYGVLIDSIEDVGQDVLSDIELALDNNDEMWVLENETLKRIMLTGDEPGRVLYSVYTPFAVKITPTVNGVWIDRSDDQTSYVSHSSRNIINTIVGNYLGYLEYNYDDERYADDAPLTIDSTWSNINWQEVIQNNYTLTEDHYQQFRISLQKSTPAENYNVPAEEEWQVNDTFTQASGTLPNDQRWTGFNRSYFTGSALRMYNYTGIETSTDPYIHSADRFYLKDDFDIRVTTELVEGRIPLAGEGEPVIHLRVNSLDVSGAYMTCRLTIRRTGQVSYLYALVNGSGGYIYPTAQPINELRLARVGDTLSAYYKYNGNWVGKTNTNATDAAVGRRYYVQIRVEYESFSDVDIYDFDASNFTSHSNIYNYCKAPHVTRIFTQKATEVYDIHPETNKPVYVKTEIPSGLELGSNYESDLAVRWRIPVE